MGMAASQARLLTITARLHDVEYQAQSIQNAKMALATQEDQVQREYLDALDATTLTVKDMKGNLITANFNTLCGINAVNVGNYRYALRDEKNRLIVSEEIAEGYEEFMSNSCNLGDKNAYTFAMYMLTGGTGFDENSAESNLHGYEDSYGTGDDAKKPHTENLEAVNSLLKNAISEIKNYNTDSKLEFDEKDSYAGNVANIEGEMNLLSDKDKSAIQKILDQADEARNKYLNKVYNSYAENIFDSMGLKSDYNEADFNYYRDMFNQIQANGGDCVSITSISSYNGIEGIGQAANDSEWLQSAIKSGQITIDKAIPDKNTGLCKFESTGVSSDSVLEYTTTSTIDKTALAKAEAKYEHKMKEIDRKDKSFDMDLSKLETERTALTTEYDSVKKVITDNIDRTFGIFS